MSKEHQAWLCVLLLLLNMIPQIREHGWRSGIFTNETVFGGMVAGYLYCLLVNGLK